MDKTIEQLFKVFSHLAREILVYAFTGFILILDLFYLDYLYNSGTFYKDFVTSKYFSVVIIIISYILGQIVMAIYCMFLEFWRFDKILYRLIFKIRFPDTKDPVDEKMIDDKAIILKDNEKLYFHYIERNVNLSIMRWNYSGVFVLISIINFICYYSSKNTINQVYWIALICIFIGWCLMVLHIYTQKENFEQIKKLKTLIKTTTGSR